MSAVIQSLAPSLAQPLDPHVFLLGQPPIAQFLLFMKKTVAQGRAIDELALTRAWRQAREYVRELQTREAGSAEKIAIAPLPTPLGPLAAEWLPESLIQRAFPAVSWHWAWVELERLVVYQRYVNLAHVEALLTELPQTLTPEAVLRFAIGHERGLPPVRMTQVSDTRFSFTCPAKELLCLDVVPLEPAAVSGFQPSGYAAAVLGIFVGFSLNALTALYTRGRLVLGNGTHRVYALLARGITHAPFLVLDVSREEDFELAAPAELSQNPALYLHAPRPPLCRDYFDERLIYRVDVPRTETVMEVDCKIQFVRNAALDLARPS